MKAEIKETMSSYPISVNYKDSLVTAYDILKRENFRHLPVVDNNYCLIGIISDRDFQRAMWPIVDVNSLEFKDSPIFKTNSIVADYMSWPAISLTEDTELLTAVQLMISEKVSAVVITKEQKVTGIITHEDLLKVLASTLENSESIQDKAKKLIYNSPIGRVFDLIARAGI